MSSNKPDLGSDRATYLFRLGAKQEGLAGTNGNNGVITVLMPQNMKRRSGPTSSTPEHGPGRQKHGHYR